MKSFQAESTAFDPDHLTALSRHRKTDEASQDIGVVLREKWFDQVTAYYTPIFGNGRAVTRSISHPVFNSSLRISPICRYLQPMIPPERFDISPPDWGILRRSRCVHMFPSNKRFDILPFLTRIFFLKLFGLEGPNKFLEKNRQAGAQSGDPGPSLTIQDFFSKSYSWFYMQRIS